MAGPSRCLLPLLLLTALAACAHDPLATIDRPRSAIRVTVSDEYARRSRLPYSVDPDKIFFEAIRKSARKLFIYDETGFQVRLVPRVPFFYVKKSDTRIPKGPGRLSASGGSVVRAVVDVEATLRVGVEDSTGRVLAILEETGESHGEGSAEEDEGARGGRVAPDTNTLEKLARVHAIRDAMVKAIAKGLPRIFGRGLDERLGARLKGDLPPLLEVSRDDGDAAAPPGSKPERAIANPPPAAKRPAAAARAAPPVAAPEAVKSAPPAAAKPRVDAPAPEPRLSLEEIRVADDGSIEPGEIVEVNARIGNVGAGEARNVSAEVIFGAGASAVGAFPRFYLGTLAPGEKKGIAFAFRTARESARGAKVPVTVRIREARSEFGVSADPALRIAHRAAARAATPAATEAARPAPPKRELDVDSEPDIPAGEKAGPDDVAIVIGNRHYSVPGVPDVDFALRDAESVKAYLLKTFGFRRENVIFEPDASSVRFNEIFGTAANPKGRLYRLVRNSGGKANVLVYYSGHGAPDLETGEAYFLPVDANPQYVDTGGYALSVFYANLSKLPVNRVTIVLDACFSGNTDKGLLFRDVSPAMVKVRKGVDAPANAILLASASVDQVSTWYPEKRHSLFTYFFLKGIQGEADADGDGALTAGEMKAYLGRNVPYWSVRLKNVDQKPVVAGDEGEVLVRLRR